MESNKQRPPERNLIPSQIKRTPGLLHIKFIFQTPSKEEVNVISNKKKSFEDKQHLSSMALIEVTMS